MTTSKPLMVTVPLVGRSTVLNDYDVGLYIGFDTEEDYAVYVEHPQHVGYVTKWRPRLAWLKVYDIEDRNKK